MSVSIPLKTESSPFEQTPTADALAETIAFLVLLPLLTLSPNLALTHSHLYRFGIVSYSFIGICKSSRRNCIGNGTTVPRVPLDSVRGYKMEDWKFGPPILVGERVVWVKNSDKPTEGGVVRWIGKLSKESGDWTVGVELDKSLPYGGTDGSWGDRKLFHCSSRKGVFLPLSRIRKEVPKQGKSNENLGNGRKKEHEEVDKSEMDSRRTLTKWTNIVKPEVDLKTSSDSDDQKSDIRKTGRRRRKRNKSPRVKREDSFTRRTESRRPISVTGRIAEDEGKGKWHKKHESCALEEKYIREFIQREISKQQNLQEGDKKMNDVKGNFKRIDEDEIHSFGGNHMESFHFNPPKKLIGRRSEAFHRREKSNGFFSFLKWFKKSKEMPELETVKDSSVTSSPLFIRRRSSSCGSVDTLFSIATANSFAFVSPIQYQAVISSSHTTYPVTPKPEDEAKNKNQSDYENNPVKDNAGVQCSVERRKKCRAPDPPGRDISLPNTLEHKKENEEEEDGKGGHRRTVSESFKDKKAGYYCHVQGKRKAPLPPSSAPLYPSLSSLKNQCPSISKKKRPAPPPPDKIEKINENEKTNKEQQEKEVLKSNSANLSPLLGLTNDNTSSPLPSRPWYKRNSVGNNLVKKESTRFGDRKKNKENEEWMPEVGFSRRPISNDSGHNIFNLLRLDRNSDKKKEEKRKSQISILANISELDREAAEIVRKEHAQEKKMLVDKDEKYYTTKNVLDSFPSMQKEPEKPITRTTKSPFDEFKLKNEPEQWKKPEVTKEESVVKNSDTSAELDYYINPWNCPKCTFENFGWEKFCEACFTVRPKFRPEPVKPPEAPKPAEPEKPAETKKPEEKAAAPVETPTKETEKAVTKEETKKEEQPNEDLEEVRRKRLAFFAGKQHNSSSELEIDETSKLKIMLKEMKDSLPKGVINKAQEEEKGKDDGRDVKNPTEHNNLGETSKDGDPKVQQTWQPVANDRNKYGAIKKVKPTTAEAIIVTKTTVLEDVIVRKAEKVSTSVQTKATVKNDAQNGKTPDNHTYANLVKIKEKDGVVDLSAPENTFTNGDIEAITAKLQKEDAADYKVDIEATSSTMEVNTLDVNRLLRKLEAAINTGHHLEAANIAKELARMKVNCSVKRQKLVPDPGSSKIVVDLYVEDKNMHKGPIQIQILPSITLGQLKMKVEREWEIPRNIQRWILGKQLATDDSKTLEEQGVVSKASPLFLYIVTPEQSVEQNEVSKNVPENGKVAAVVGEARRPSLIIEEEEEEDCRCEETEDDEPKPHKPVEISTPAAQRREMFRRKDSQTSFSFEKREMNENLKKELKVITANSVKERIEQLYRAATGAASAADPNKHKGDNRPEAGKQKFHYNELMQLENADLVPNAEEFECPICLVEYAPGEGVVLKDCLHTFCRPCLVNTIQFNEEAEVKCPYRDDKYSCESVLQQREIKSLVPKGIFEQHLAKSVSVAENNIGNAYHCKTPDCKGWCILEDNVNEFRCPVCRITNCLTCQSIHTGMNCRQYQEQIQFASDTNVEAKKTRDMLQEMVEKGEAMACPTCQVVLMKKWGCDWLRCSMCKTEICWVTRGPRWGPAGKGDTTGGCQCGVNGIKCHPKCNYCH